MRKWDQFKKEWVDVPPFPMPKEKEEREGTFKPRPKHRVLKAIGKAFGIIVMVIVIIILLRFLFNVM